MANKARGEVTLNLGGETHVLVPSFGAVCEIEEKIGANLFNMGRRLELVEVSARDLIDFAHACVTQAGHKVDKERLGELIVEAGTHTVIEALTEFCRNYAFGGRPEKKAAKKPAKAKRTPKSEATPAASS